MSTPQTSLRVRISADLRDIRQGLGLLRGELAKVKADSAKAMPSSTGFAAGLRAARRELVGLASVYVSLRSARVFATLSDEATQLRGRLRAARGDYEAILALAQETRTGLTGTVDLYTRLERSTRAQGVNAERLLTVTKAVNQAVRLSFATGAAGEAALVQLGQGLSSGTLRGEELNSVMEQTPRLAQALADGMNVSLGQLRALAKEGKITTAVSLGALEDQARALDSEFRQVPLTIGEALVQVRNSFLDFIGDQNEATGASQKFSKLLQQAAKDLPKFFEPILKVMVQLAGNINTVAAASDGLAGAAANAGKQGTALAEVGGFLANIFRVLAAGAILVKNTVEAVTVAVAALIDIAMTAADALGRALGGAFGAIAGSFGVLKSDGPLAALKAYRQGIGSVVSDLAALPGRLKGKAKVAGETVAEEFGDATGGIANLFSDVEADVAKVAAAVAAASQGAGEGAEDANGKAGKAIAASNALLRDSIARALKELDRLYSENEIGAARYFAARRKLQEDAIDAEVAQAQAELAVTKELGQRRQIEEELIRLQRERAEIGPAAAREQAAAEQQATQALDGLRSRLMQAQGDSLGAQTLQLRAEFGQLLKELPADARVAGKAILDELLPLELSKAQIAAFGEELQRITGDLGASETALGAQRAGGLIGAVEAEDQLIAARERALSQLRALREGALAYYEATKDPSVLTFLQQLDGNIGEVVASQNLLAQQTQDLATSGLTTFFSDLAGGVKSFKDAAVDMVKSFIDGMTQLAAKALATFLVMKAFDTVMPGFTQIMASLSGVKHHSGGVVGSGGTAASNLNPMLFGAAPRYHSGGFAGLDSNEVAAVLERGEEVLTERDPRHTRNGGRRGTSSDVIVNVHNNGGGQVETKQSMQGGDRVIDVFVEKAVNAVAANMAKGGSVAKATGSRFGLSPVGVQRG